MIWISVFNRKSFLLGSLSFATVLMVGNWSGAIAQSNNGVSWRRLGEIASPRILPLIPSRFLNGFENGGIALTASNNYRTAYVIAKNGVSLDRISTVGNFSGRGSFFQVENEARLLPAIEEFPQSQYDASQMIEIIYNAPRDGGESTRNRARQSRQSTLSNGKTAYYMRQATGRQGWCVFTDISARYSDFTCVNITNSPKAALTVLDSLPLRQNGLKVD